MALGSAQRCVGLIILPPSCAEILKSGSLNPLETSGPVQGFFYLHIVSFQKTKPFWKKNICSSTSSIILSVCSFLSQQRNYVARYTLKSQSVVQYTSKCWKRNLELKCPLGVRLLVPWLCDCRYYFSCLCYSWMLSMQSKYNRYFLSFLAWDDMLKSSVFTLVSCFLYLSLKDPAIPFLILLS
jgi:hypothetical protein